LSDPERFPQDCYEQQKGLSERVGEVPTQLLFTQHPVST
jgi:hypothetical protein